mgnify:CR=1 FL=1
MQINDFTALVFKKIRDEKIEQIQIGQNFNYDFSAPNTIKQIKFPQNSKFTKTIKFYNVSENIFHTPTELIMGKKYKEYYKETIIV